jgi:signal transduction histidine kinase
LPWHLVGGARFETASAASLVFGSALWRACGAFGDAAARSLARVRSFRRCSGPLSARRLTVPQEKQDGTSDPNGLRDGVSRIRPPFSRAPRWWSYLLAVALGTLAVALGHWTPMLMELKVPLLAAASLFVGICAWLGGLGPGLVCTALCVLSAAEWLEPNRSLRVARTAEVLGLLIFTIVGVGLSVICEQLHRAQRAAYRAAELEHGARRLRDEVITLVARDLANPLVTIDANAELIEADSAGDPLHAVLSKRASILRRSVARIRRMLLDLLDIAALETGEVSVSPTPQPSSTLLDEAADLYHEDADAKSVSIVLSAPDHAPCVWADHDRILQVLSHLTARALRATPPGGHLQLSVEPHDTFARFALREIGRDERPEVALRFFHALQTQDDGRVRMALVEAIVKAHGGEMTVPTTHSIEPLSFTLPLA